MIETTFTPEHLAKIKSLPGLPEELAANFDDFSLITSAKRLRGCIFRASRLMRQYGACNVADLYMARAQSLRGQRLDSEQITVALLSIGLELQIGSWGAPMNTLDCLGGLPDTK